MGLDNGLICANAPKTKEFDRFRDGYHAENRIEFCYWRKCWDFRNEIIDAGLGLDAGIQWKNPEKPLDYKYLNVPQLEEFREILVKYTDPKYIKEHNEDSMWDDDEIIGIMQSELTKLDYFILLMKQSPGLKVYFYDSY